MEKEMTPEFTWTLDAVPMSTNKTIRLTNYKRGVLNELWEEKMLLVCGVPNRLVTTKVKIKVTMHRFGLQSKDNDCGGIYGVAAPAVNACKAPTIWQTYDIEFTAPRCQDGKKVANGRITVFHNGVKIHDNVEITKDNTTAGLGGDVCTPGPIMLQDHGNPVQYRNIWLAPKRKRGQDSFS